VRRLLPGLVLAALVLPSRADATVVKAMTLEEKTEAAPLIVHAIVERIESEWNLPGASARTLITIRVLETIKGDAAKGETLIVHQSGGRIGDFHQTAPGLSTFEAGEECVLFLEPMGAYLVELGIGIGKYAIEPAGDEKWVTHAPKVAGYRVSTEDGRGRIEPIAPMKPEPLKLFLKRVRSFVQHIPENTVTPRKGVELKPAPLRR
jgi:hypothetical protein